MRLGISSWTFPWAVGVRGFPLPAKPIRLADLLAKASLLKVGVVQVADNLPVHKLDRTELRDARDQAASQGLEIEIGTRGVEAEHLRNYLRLAREFDARLIRTLTGGFESRPTLEEAESCIREVLPEFEAQRVTLGLENYELHSCHGLADLVRRLESRYVGVCLDTTNSFGALETLQQVIQTLAPHTVNLHIKDFVVERASHSMGFVVRGACAGAGWLDIPWLLARIPQRNDISVILEQWPPPAESVEAAAEIEQQWAESGIQYLRSCGCK